MKTPEIFLIVALLAGATCAAQNVKVTYYTSEIVRIEKSADGAGRSQKSVSVILEPSAKVLKPKVKVGGESRLFSPTRRKGRCLGDACQVTGISYQTALWLYQ